MSERANALVGEGERKREKKLKNEKLENRSLNPFTNLFPQKQVKSVKTAEPY